MLPEHPELSVCNATAHELQVSIFTNSEYQNFNLDRTLKPVCGSGSGFGFMGVINSSC